MYPKLKFLLPNYRSISTKNILGILSESFSFAKYLHFELLVILTEKVYCVKRVEISEITGVPIIVKKMAIYILLCKLIKPFRYILSVINFISTMIHII